MKMNEDRVDRGWMRMTTILDASMPQKKKKRRPILLWWLGATCLLAAVFLILDPSSDSQEKKQSLVASSYHEDPNPQNHKTEGENQTGQTILKPATVMKSRQALASLPSRSSPYPVISRLQIPPLSVVGANERTKSLQLPPISVQVKKKTPTVFYPLSPRKFVLPKQGIASFDQEAIDIQNAKELPWYLGFSVNQAQDIRRPGYSLAIGLEKSFGRRWSWQSELNYTVLGSVGMEGVNDEFASLYRADQLSVNPQESNPSIDNLSIGFPINWNHLGLHLGVKGTIKKRWALGVYAQCQYFTRLPGSSSLPSNIESKAWVPAIGADLTYRMNARWQVRLMHRRQVIPVFRVDDQALYLNQWQLGVQYFWKK